MIIIMAATVKRGGLVEVCLADKYGEMNRLVLFQRQFNADKKTDSTGLRNLLLIFQEATPQTEIGKK